MKKMTTYATALLTIIMIALSVQAVTVYDIVVNPNPLRTYTYFKAITDPAEYSLDWIQVWVYNLGGQQVAHLYAEDTWRIYWDGDNLANGPYLYISECYDFDQGVEVSETFGPYALYILK